MATTTKVYLAMFCFIYSAITKNGYIPLSAATGTAYTVNLSPPHKEKIPMPMRGRAKIKALCLITNTT